MPLNYKTPIRGAIKIYFNIVLVSTLMTMGLIFWLDSDHTAVKPWISNKAAPDTTHSTNPSPRIWYGKPKHPANGDMWIDTIANKIYIYRISNLIIEGGAPTSPNWIYPSGIDYFLNKDPKTKKLWENQQKLKNLNNSEKTLDDFDEAEVEDWYEARRD